MNNNAIYSTMIRSGRITYFIDIREAKNGKRYLSVSENSLDGENKRRSTIRVFSESIEQFKQAIEEAVSAAQ